MGNQIRHRGHGCDGLVATRIVAEYKDGAWCAHIEYNDNSHESFAWGETLKEAIDASLRDGPVN